MTRGQVIESVRATVFFAVMTPLVIALSVGALLALAWMADAAGLDTVIDPPRPSADEAHLLLAGTTYQDLAGVAACTSTCAGHEAGFRWARDNGIADPADCGGNSRSFTEGCWTYGEAVVRITG